MAKVEWTANAQDELLGIFQYITDYSDMAARRLADQIQLAMDRVAMYPMIGRQVPELPHRDLREVIVASYRIIYRFDDGRQIIRVLAVRHGRRRFAHIDEH